MEWIFLLMPLLSPCQETLEGILEGWRSDDPALRDEASRRLLARARDWTEADLARLEKAAQGGERESAGRAMAALPRIRLRRKYGPDLVAKAEAVEAELPRIREPEGKVREGPWGIPGGPMMQRTPPVRRLIAMGPDVQPFLMAHLKDPSVRNEIALVLAETGGPECLPVLIEALPDGAELKDPLEYLCLEIALSSLTGLHIGIQRFGLDYTPRNKARWKSWYEENKAHLYPRRPAGGVALDMEAKVAGVAVGDFRSRRPRIRYDEIATWKTEAEYVRRLRAFCLSTLIDGVWSRGDYSRDGIRRLASLSDAESLATLHALVAWVNPDSIAAHDVAWSLDDRSDPASIPYLEKLASRGGKYAGRARQTAERIRLRKDRGADLDGLPLSRGDGDWYLRSLGSAEAVREICADLRKDPFNQRGAATVAGFVRKPEVVDALKEVFAAEATDEVIRTHVAVALHRQGEGDRLPWLRDRLNHRRPALRLAAAEGLRGLGNKEGLGTLLELLRLKPIEGGGEAPREPNVEIIRGACEVLGKLGDPAAIPDLKALLAENLNGVAVTGGSGASWGGRPDAAALARLGDLSGLEVLRQSIRKGDPMGVLGGWGGPGDCATIGLKRLIPDILPLLNSPTKCLDAAGTILTLLDHGK